MTITILSSCGICDERRVRKLNRLFKQIIVIAKVLVALLLVIQFIPACAPETEDKAAVSLNQASQILGSFERFKFIPPPKSIADVENVLDAQPLTKRAARERDREFATTPPSKSMSGSELADFYYRRGRAAQRIGDVQQWYEDLAAAVANADAFNDRQQMLWQLGTAARFAGRYRDAFRYRRQALDLVRRRGRRFKWTANIAVSLAGTGNVAAATEWLSDAENQLEVLKQRRRRWERNKDNLMLRLDRARGAVLDAIGRHEEAEGYWRSAITRWQHYREGFAENPEDFKELLHRRLSLNLLAQGRLLEAEYEVRQALGRTLARVGKFAPTTALLLNSFNRILVGQGRVLEAEQLVVATIEILRSLGTSEKSIPLLRARERFADLLAVRGRWKESAQEFRAIELLVGSDQASFMGSFEHNPNRALVEALQGNSDAAIRLASRNHQFNAEYKGPDHYDTAESLGILAVALVRAGQHTTARSAFVDAMPVLLRHARRWQGEESTRTEQQSRLAVIFEAYIDLLSRVGDDAAVAEAFRVADAARTQTVQRALAASSARAAANDPALGRLVRKEQDAVKVIGALNELLVSVTSIPIDQQDPSVIRELRKRIGRFRDARLVLVDEIERQFPAYASLASPRPTTIDEARSALLPGEALVATFTGTDRIYVWAVPKSGPVNFVAAPIGRVRLASIVSDLRRALNPRARTLGEIPQFDVRASHRLYQTLLEPVVSAWKSAKRLLVVTDGALGQLPFGVLVTAPTELGVETTPMFSNYRAVPFLARSYAVTVLPSVTSLAMLRRLPATRSVRGFAGFGDPWFSTTQAQEAEAAQTSARGARLAARGIPIRLRATPALRLVSSADLAQLPRLPGTADEIRGIALALKADPIRDVFTGRAASEGRVKSMDLSSTRVLAFATHGLVPGDLNGLTQPALALTSPTVVGGSDDGLLTMSEILGLRLDADWVVLSACNTAAGAGTGAEAISGLGRAFFYAGTRALLVSNWPVETTSARALTTELFRRQAADPKLTRAEALRRTMLGLIDGPGLTDDKGRTLFSYAHPIFWAPFSLVGDGGETALGGS